MSATLRNFSVKAFRGSGAVTRLTISALSAADARSSVESRGLTVIAVDTTLLGAGSRSPLSAEMLATEVVALLRAGLTLPEAMSALTTRARSREATQVVERIAESIRQGRTFSQALSTSGGGFSELFIATVRSSEQTGNLVEALTRYIEYDRRMKEVRSTLISASIYPIIVLVAGALAIAFLLGYVIPRFSRLYEDLGEAKIPLASRLLMHLGVFIDHHSAAIGLTALVSMAFISLAATQPAIRIWSSRKMWSMPVFGAKLQLYSLARLSHTLSMLLRGGIPFVQSLDMAVDVLPTPALRANLSAARIKISQGQTIASTFVRHDLATDIGSRLLAAGERTGNMAEMTAHTARLYDDELALWLQRFIKLFEPVLMIAIGLTVGALVMLMYLPIFGLASSIE